MADTQTTGNLILATLKAKGIEAAFNGISQGPRMTSYKLVLAGRTRVRQVVLLEPDLKVALGNAQVAVRWGDGLYVDVPGAQASVLWRGGVIGAAVPLGFCLGRDGAGDWVWDSLADLPHLLIAGQTGAGKSVALQGLICSLLRYSPDSVKLALVDVKRVELAPYKRVPHLIAPVAETSAAARALLAEVEAEVQRRYKLLSVAGFKCAADFKAAGNRLPYLVLVIDELSDVMTSGSSEKSKEEAEEIRASLVRIMQLSRAAGVHVVAATQRPDSSTVSGNLKANMPAVLALAVKSPVDARVVGVAGADKLLGKGDAIYTRPGRTAVRLQIGLVEDWDIQAAIAKWPAKDPEPPKPSVYSSQGGPKQTAAVPLPSYKPSRPPAPPKQPKWVSPAPVPGRYSFWGEPAAMIGCCWYPLGFLLLAIWLLYPILKVCWGE